MNRVILFGVLIICLTHTCVGQGLYKDLLVYYSFDGHVRDASGNEFHGDPNNIQYVVDHNGNVGNACYFNGDSYVDMPSDKKLQPELPVSFSFWFKLDNYNQNLIAFFDMDYFEDYYYGFYCTMTEAVRTIGMGIGDGGFIDAGSRRSARGSTIINVNEWYHVAGIIKSATNMEIYIDGCKEDIIYSGFGKEQIVYSDGNGSIGRIDAERRANSNIYHLEGALDELYIWNRVITNEEILILSEQQSETSELIQIRDTTLCIDSTLEVRISDNFDDIIWNDGSREHIYTISEEGTYWVTALYNDCVVLTDTINVKFSACDTVMCEVNIPLAFSPNNDGLNDIFEVIISESCILQNSELRIYSRWGQLVHQGSFENPWDGKFKGEDAVSEVYIYTATYTFRGIKGTESHQLKGNITLIR